MYHSLVFVFLPENVHNQKFRKIKNIFLYSWFGYKRNLWLGRKDIFICYSCVFLFTLLSVPGMPSPNSLSDKIPLNSKVQAGTCGKHPCRVANSLLRIPKAPQISPLKHLLHCGYVAVLPPPTPQIKTKFSSFFFLHPQCPTQYLE